MYVLIILLIIAVVCFITYLLCSSLSSIGDRATAAKILQYGKDSEYYIYDICTAVQPSENVFRNLYLPVETKSGTHYTEIDLVVVNSGGIAVFEVKGHKGHIINPRVGSWIQRHKKKFLKFENPFEQNDRHIAILVNDLRKAGFNKKVPVKNIVVFTDDKVRFNMQYASLLKAKDVAPFLRKMSGYKSISKQDVSTICGILEKYRRSHRKELMRDIKARERTGNKRQQQTQ